MSHNTLGLHHFQLRKRIHEGLEAYPHPDKFKRVIDKLIFFVGLVGPIMTIPQVTNIWIDKNAAGVSLITWSTYVVTSIFWLMYGISHKEKPIIVTYTAWLFLDASVAVGTFIYS